jgi:hypothetical protein
MKRLALIAVMCLFVLQTGCRSNGGGTDPKKRQERINIPVE